MFERIRAWNAWKSRLRPLAILKPGLKAHLFNKGCRALVGLYEIENCSVFDFSKVTQFADEVKRVSGKGVLLQGHFTDEVERVSGKGVLLQENPASRKWSEIIEQRLKEKKGAPLHGYVFTARLLDCLDPCLRLSGKFPLHGWCDLQAPNFGMRT